MARLAVNAFHGNMLLMRKKNLVRRGRAKHNVFWVRMAEVAIVSNLLLMAGSTLIMGAAEIIGGKLARCRRGMACTAFCSHIRNMKFM
jgi:hypothetical protein